MPPKRKRVDPDVVVTERDTRRATGREDDDEFEVDDAEQKVNLNRMYVTAGFSRYKRAKLRKSINATDDDDPFPFMRLPPEIRNMIYRYLVVSKAPCKIRLDEPKNFRAGGIEINVMLTCRLAYNEASAILYDENECMAVWTKWDRGVAIRIDEPNTASRASRSLRSGRAVDMVKHKGLIYKESLHKLKKVEFRLEVFDRCNLCDHMALFYATKIYRTFEELATILRERANKPSMYEALKHGEDWEVVIQSMGHGLGPNLLRKMLEPIISGSYRALREKKLKMVLDGQFPKTWKKIFRADSNSNDVSIVTDKLEINENARASDVRGMDRDDLDFFFDVDPMMW